MTAFVAVADLRGFAAAARRLKWSPSAVTRLIAALEDQLSIRLLQRTTRSVTLTDAGARYLERARRILADVTEAEAAARAERTTPTGRFVVTAPSVFGRRQVAPVFFAFLAKYPEVAGELVLSDRMMSLVEDGIDVAIRIGVLEDSSLVAKKVGATRRVVVAAPKYLARAKRLRSPRDLTSHDIIQFTGLHPTPAWRFVRDGDDETVAFAPHFVTNDADVAIRRAEVGGGVAMVLAYQVSDAIRAGRLEIMLAGFEPPPLPIHLLHPTTRLLSANVRVFGELVLSSCDWQFGP